MSDTGQISDGYHTFDELYEHRHRLFLALMQCYKNDAWIADRNSDGAKWDGWFVAGINLPTGTVTYHLPERLCDDAISTGAVIFDVAPAWDGHTSADVVDRLAGLVNKHT